jgi:glucose-1-phosphate thymidylyltransferase
VGDKPIVEHIVDKVQRIEEVDEILIVTNHRFFPMFNSWLKDYNSEKKVRILNDGTINNGDRLGAVGDLHFVIKEEEINDDVLLIAGDNLFGFKLRDFHTSFVEKGSTMVAFHDLKETEKVANKFGVGILGEGSKVLEFEEKPAEPRSTLAATCCYIFTSQDVKKVSEYMANGEKWDNPGDLANWLVKQSEVHGFVFDEHWFDIGSFEGLEEAGKFYEGRE